MTGRLRDIINLLLYGGAFIGLCASSITALTFELIGGIETQFNYILLIGVATAALYSAHRVLGLQKLAHITTTDRYAVIRNYKQHIWLYCIVWIVVTGWLFIPMASLSLILWLIPGGVIALAYVLPFLSKGRRLRDVGWVKIIMIGWSWAWLTAFLPAYYLTEITLHLALLLGFERMLFIIALTIPFEIRDMTIDKSVGLMTMPSRFGMARTVRAGQLFCFLVIMLSLLSAFHFMNPAYFISTFIVIMITMWILKKSQYVTDDYFFSGLTDGLMILSLVFYWVISVFL